MATLETQDDPYRAAACVPGVSYGRVSSEKQLTGKGLERSLEGCLNWIANNPEHRVRLDHTLVDRALSAWKGEHITDGEFGRLLRMIDDGIIRPGTYIFVDDHDRISRRPVWEATHLLTGLIKAGMVIVTTIDGTVYSQKSGVGDLIVSVVKMDAAHGQSEQKSNRVRFSKAARIEEAMTTKYVIHKNAPGWLYVAEAISSANRATRKYETIDRHVQTVREIFQMALHHGPAYITVWLIKNREAFGRSGKWNTFYVRDILSSQAVLGHLETRHGTIENTLPKIIDEDLWLRVQAASEARRGQGGHKTGAYVNLFATLCRCVACGGMMRINTNRRTGYKYYECKNHSTLKTCANRCRYRVDVIERHLLNDLGWLKIGGQRRRTPIDLTALEDEHLKLDARYKRLASKLQELDDDEMFSEIEKQLRELRHKRADVAARMNAARQEIAIAAVPVQIDAISDRAKLHTALQQLIKGAYFGEHHEVAIVSRAGLLLMVTARQGTAPPYLLMLRHDGQMAIVDEHGKLRVTEASTDLIAAGMTPLDAKTIDDMLAHLHQIKT
jgi:hypothetical protein